MMNRQQYIEAHSIEWDILHSQCRDCYINNLDCLHDKCRKEEEVKNR